MLLSSWVSLSGQFWDQFYSHRTCFPWDILSIDMAFLSLLCRWHANLPVRATDPACWVPYMITYARSEIGCHKISCSSTQEIVVIGSQHVEKQILPPAGSLLEHIKPVGKNLGIWCDSKLSFEQHTTKQKSSFYHLRNISKIWSILSFEDTETISSRLDDCNSQEKWPHHPCFSLLALAPSVSELILRFYCWLLRLFKTSLHAIYLSS